MAVSRVRIDLDAWIKNGADLFDRRSCEGQPLN